MDEMDPVFKALSDAHRRHLLDRLFDRDGQTLTELQGSLPLSRFGSMKHLRILEEAGLITSRKIGRERFHYLNPVPIQRAYDRWVAKFARPWTSLLSGLKTSTEQHAMSTTAATKPNHVYQMFIRATPELVWQAITDPDMTSQYYFGTRIESDFQPESPYVYRLPDGAAMLDGTILESDPPRRLVMSFRPVWLGLGEATSVSRVTWEIAADEDQSKLTMIHEDLDLNSELGKGIVDGWTRIISAMKTVVESQTAPVLAGV